MPTIHLTNEMSLVVLDAIGAKRRIATALTKSIMQVMDTTEKTEQVRPLYLSLKGLMAEAPNGSGISNIRGKHPAETANSIIDKIVLIDDDAELNQYKTEVHPDTDGFKFVEIIQYRANLTGLIMYLFGKYFYETETEPFGVGPNNVTYQSLTQVQSQSIDVNILLQFQEFINDKLNEEDLESNEKSFLEAIKAKIANIKKVGDIISLILTTAQAYGVAIDKLVEIFKNLRI